MPVVRELITLFGLDVDKAGFRSADARVDKLRRGITNLARVLVGGVVVNELRKLTTETARLGDSIDKTSGKIGLEAEALQELRFAAELAGVAQNTTDMALQRFGRRAAEAAQGTGEAKDALRELGVQLTDATGKLRPTAELLGDVADGLQRARTDGDRLRLAFKLFDSEGVGFINALKNGRQALEESRAEARALGGILDQDLIKLSVDYTDAQTRLGQALRGVKNEIARGLLPAVIQTTKALTEWVKRNREVLSADILRALRAFGRLVSGAAALVGRLVQGIGALSEHLPPLAQDLALIIGLFGALTLAIGFKAAAVFLLIGAIDDLVGFLRGEKSLLGEWSKFLTQLYEDLVNNPIQPEDVWFVKVVQVFAQWIERAQNDLAEMIGLFNTDASLERVVRLLKKSARTVARLDPRFAIGELAGEVGRQVLAPALGRGVDQQVEGFLNRHVAPRLPDVSNNVTVQQTINAAPGQSEQAVGQAAARGAAQALAEQNRRMVRALVPQTQE